MASVSGVEVVTNAMRSHPADPNIQHQACQALAKLCLDRKKFPLFFK